MAILPSRPNHHRPAASTAALESGLDKSGMDSAVRPQDDLSRAGNGHWLATTKIPADKSAYGSFTLLADAASWLAVRAESAVCRTVSPMVILC